MSKITWILAVAVSCILSACTTVDRNAAASLGAAGVAATRALSDQTSAANQSIANVSQWWPIEATLDCSAVTKADLRAVCLIGASSAKPDLTLTKSLSQIADVLDKHKQAIDTLNHAYAAFSDLAKYNAGQEASTALAQSFKDTKAFLSAASALPASSGALTALATAQKFAGIGVSVVADNQENVQLLAASKDLRAENDALYAGLELEGNAVVNLFGTLQTERIALYKSALTAGLIAPTDVLTPVFAEAYPGIQLKASGPNADLVMAAANDSLTAQAQAGTVSVARSYDSALATLHAVSAQHERFEAKQPINLSGIEAQVNNIESNVSAMSSSTVTKQTSK